MIVSFLTCPSLYMASWYFQSFADLIDFKLTFFKKLNSSLFLFRAIPFFRLSLRSILIL